MRLVLISHLVVLVLVFTGCAKNLAHSESTASEKQARQAFSRLRGEQQQTVNQVNSCVAFRAGADKASAPGPYATVQIDTFFVFNTEVSIKDARIKTMQWIREIALERALPADIKLSSLTTDMYIEHGEKFDEQTAKSVFMMSSVAGKFISEEVLNSYWNACSDGGSYKYAISYRAVIEQVPKTYNAHLNVRVGLSNSLLRNREKTSVTVTANNSGYLYVFDFLPDNTAALVFPTTMYRNNYIQADTEWKQQIEVMIEPSKEYSIETLYFVFSTQEISGWEDFKSNVNAEDMVFSAGTESFVLFQKWLGRGDPSQRVEKMAQIHIVK